MLHHFSFNARDAAFVAASLAALLSARSLRAPSPPFPAGSWFVCVGDAPGTLIEVMPWGETRDPDGPNGVGQDADMRPNSGSHILIGTPLSTARLLDEATRFGWRAETASAGLFKFVKVWVENAFLVEFLPPEHQAEYRAAFGPAGIDRLDQELRGIERAMRSMKA
jgi:hypothetical protein